MSSDILDLIYMHSLEWTIMYSAHNTSDSKNTHLSVVGSSKTSIWRTAQHLYSFLSTKLSINDEYDVI